MFQQKLSIINLLEELLQDCCIKLDKEYLICKICMNNYVEKGCGYMLG